MTDTPMTFNLKGLTCAHCIGRVEQSLKALPGVTRVGVTLTQAQLWGTVDPEAVTAAVAALGYSAHRKDEGRAPLNSAPAPSAMASTTLETPEQSEAQAPAAPEMPSRTFAITGMTCASCVRSVEEAVAAVAGVRSVRVNLAERSALVSGDFDPAAVLTALTQAGYSAALSSAEAAPAPAAPFWPPLLSLALGLLMMLMPQGRMMGAVAAFVVLALFGGVGRRYFLGAWQALKHRRATMDTLVALGTGTAWLYSCAVLLLPQGFLTPHTYFEAAAMILGLVGLGSAIEERARAHTNTALRRLMDLRPLRAHKLSADGVEDIPLEAVTVGMTLRVWPGEKIPVDGTVTAGESRVDESLLTGEPQSRRKDVGDELFAGTLNEGGSLTMVAERVGTETTLARIIALVRRAQSSKPELARLVDRVAAVFVPVVMVLAVGAALLWWFLGPEPRGAHALMAAVSVLIVACPCAMGLATPLSVTAGVGRAAELGLLVRDAEALQRAASIDAVVFDKTGTLTEGKMSVRSVVTFNNREAETLTAQAAAVEAHSEHPLARALAAAGRGGEVRDFVAVPGRGVAGTVNGLRLKLGNRAYLEAEGVDVSAAESALCEIAARGETAVLAAEDGVLAGVFALGDTLRADARDTVQALRAAGYQVYLLSGDSRATAEALAVACGIEEVKAEVLPAEKAAFVLELQRAGHKVAMVGDGVNDAPALATAEVGIAMGSGSDVALESAGFALLQAKTMGVAVALSLSRAVLANMRGNLWWAFFYNLCAIPVAAGALYPLWGITASPVWASAAMALSSITVVLHANRLRFWQP